MTAARSAADKMNCSVEDRPIQNFNPAEGQPAQWLVARDPLHTKIINLMRKYCPKVAFLK